MASNVKLKLYINSFVVNMCSGLIILAAETTVLKV